MLKQSLAATALFALAACSSGNRPYQELGVGEKADFEKCRFEQIRQRPAVENKTGTVGGAIDGILDLPKRMAELNQKAIRECAGKMKVDPKTVPGWTP